MFLSLFNFLCATYVTAARFVAVHSVLARANRVDSLRDNHDPDLALTHASLTVETPRLCRGGINSLTFKGVHQLNFQP